MKCVLRSRTLPTLIRSDRGVEFKNDLMQELNALLGARRCIKRFRKCWGVVRQVGAIDAWSDWLVVVEYVIDNTPGFHGYTPRDLERPLSS